MQKFRNNSIFQIFLCSIFYQIQTKTTCEESCLLIFYKYSYIVGHRYPIINSGDRIALRSAYTSGSYVNYWMRCKSSYCRWYTCPGQVMTSSAWSSCSSYMFYYIHAMGKMNGQPINSGDVVSLSSYGYGSRYRLYCGTSTSTKCYMTS